MSFASHWRKSRRASTALTLVALVAVAALLVGCSAKEPAEQPEPPAPKVASSSAKVSGTLDPAHPADIPVWEGAKVVSSVLAGETIYDLELSTTDGIEDVKYGVGTGLEEEGFTVEKLDETDTSIALMAVKGDLAALYTVESTDAGTSIVISVQLPSAE